MIKRMDEEAKASFEEMYLTYQDTLRRLAYAYDLRVFFEFMHENNPYCNKVGITELPLSVLDHISREDIEEYMDYLTLYIKDGKVTNPENRTLYDYPNVEVILEKKDSEDGTAVPDTLLQAS